MSDPASGEPLQSVLAAARAIDPDFTEVILKKWRDRGLVPRPQSRPGRGRRRDELGGRDAIYPTGTSEQLRRLLGVRQAARESGKRFRPEQALWEVWWSGGYGRPDAIRALLRAHADSFKETIGAVGQQIDADSEGEHPTTVVDDAARKLSGAPVNAARRRTGTRGFPTLLYFLLNLARGQFPGFLDDEPSGYRRRAADLDDRRIFEQGTGLNRAQAWLEAPLEHQLHAFAGLVSPSRVVEALEITPDEDLEEARDEVQILVGMLYSLRLTLEGMYGPDALGLAGALHPNDLDAAVQQRLIVYWLAFRSEPSLREGYRTLTETAGFVAPLQTFMELTRSATTRELPRHLPADNESSNQEGR